MVNTNQTTGQKDEGLAVASGGGGKQQKDHQRLGESSPESKQDCHNIVKSSGLGTKKRICCEHGHKMKNLKVSVACQTDDAVGGGPTSNDGAKISSTAFESAVFCNPTEPALSAATALRISAPQTSPKQDGDDGTKCEGTLRLMIHNFRNMNDTVRGPAKVINTVPWKIMVMPRQHVVAKKGTQKCLGFFLQCFPESYSDSWSCQAAAELRLISQKPGVPNFVRKTNHVYTAKENDWGYSCFMTWVDILEEAQGYMKDENVILEVYVKADAPKGILTHDQFCKKIQDYMRLADMQCSRNLIDKALEVNQTALKFCKDKDEGMKDELEKQRARLIEQKLKQSIERIEKGYAEVKSLENGEAGTNLNTLRQALAGNFAALKNANAAAVAATGGTKTQQTTTPGLKENNKNAIGQKQTAPTAKDSQTKTDENKPTNQQDVKSNVDVPVAGIKRGRGNGTLKEDWKLDLPQRVVEIDDPEAGTSDESDDESDYEDMDEVCDSCLVEKLDNMSCGGIGIDGAIVFGVGSGSTADTIVETQENGCQTDAPIAKPRLPPVGSTQTDETKQKSPTSNNNNNNSNNNNNAASIQTDGTNQPAKQKAQLQLSTESEQKILQLISDESKASLNTIKDTLERLVLLAQGGDSTTTPAPNVQLDFGNYKKFENVPPHLMQKMNLPLENVKTDVVEILPTEKEAVESNLKTIMMNNQIVAASKKRQHHEQFENILNDDLDEEKSFSKALERQKQVQIRQEQQKLQQQLQQQQQQLHQQFVQTELSYTPRAGSPTAEDRTLLARAQAIVENKAEELVTKYSQLIEQSEANRLAETVKKVEKRMKDIEKQTMTCRKELSDECDRHFREEQKWNKANKQLKLQVEQANEKIDKLNNQLKEKRAEVKKLEKRLKAETQSSAENAELNSKIEQLDRDLASARQKHSDEKQRWNEEQQKLQETKRSLQQELSFTTAEVERLHTQLEEKNGAIRKLETSLKQERQQAQTQLKEAAERAKKAEVMLMELRLDIGLKGLQRVLDECQSHIAQLEDSAKRFTRMQMIDEAKTSTSCLQEWRKTKDKIQELIQKAKHEFGQQIDAIKAGKSLSSLPTLEVPRPPPPPPTPKLFLSVQTPPEQRQQHIAPIGTAAVGSKGSTVPSSPQPPVVSSPAVSNGPNAANPHQRAPSVPPSGLCNGPSTQQPPTTTMYHGTTVNSSSPPQQPSNLSQPTDTSVSSTVQFDQSTYTQGASVSGSGMGNGPGYSSGNNTSPAVSGPSRTKGVMESGLHSSSGGGGASDFTPWATDPLNIMHALIGAKVGGFDGGFNAASSSSSNANLPSGQNELMNGGYGVGSGNGPHGGGRPHEWSGHQQQQQHHHHWTQPPPNVRSSNRAQGNGSPQQQSYDRSDSPMEKKTEALIDQLRNIFPNLSPDFIRECVYECRQYAKNFKNMPFDQLVNSAVGFVLSRQQQHAPKMGNWNSSNMPNVMGPGGGNATGGATGYDTGHGDGPTSTQNDDACSICCYALRMQPACALRPCSHVFHSACITQWLLNHRTCPSCGALALQPEEYPELS